MRKSDCSYCASGASHIICDHAIKRPRIPHALGILSLAVVLVVWFWSTWTITRIVVVWAEPVYVCVKGHTSQQNAPVIAGDTRYCGRCFADFVDANVNKTYPR